MARRVLGKDIKITTGRCIEIFILALIAMTQIYYFCVGHWYTLLTMPLTYWIFGSNVFHDASHFGLSFNWKINRIGNNVGFIFSTPYAWYHQHVIGHHSFPNIKGKDPDLYHSPVLVRHSSDVRFKSKHSYQTITFLITWILGVSVGLLFYGVTQAFNKPKYNRCVTFNNSKHLNTDSLRFRLGFYTLVIHIMPLIMHGLTIKGLIFTVLPIYVFSTLFMISSQINHLVPDANEQFSSNFFKHQVLTANNVATDNYLVYLLTGGLNMQIEHHLFPSINHCHLKALQPHVREICKKHNVAYHESKTLWEAVRQHVEHLRQFSKA